MAREIRVRDGEGGGGPGGGGGGGGLSKTEAWVEGLFHQKPEMEG